MPQVFEALDREWAHVVDSADARRALARWRETEPALASVSLDELLARRRCPTDATEILAALARLAPRDRLAARTLVQALIPGLGALAKRLGGGRRDLAADLVSLAWERIRTYPPTRTGSVAGNVLLDVRKMYLASQQPPRSDVVIDRCASIDHAPPSPSAEDEALRFDDGRAVALRRILAAGERGVVSDDVLRAILRTRLEGETVEEAAANECVSPRVLRHRRWRGERALRDRLARLPLAG